MVKPGERKKVDIYNALKLIAARCPLLASEAIKGLSITSSKALQMHYRWLLSQALEDPSGSHFNADERAALIALLEPIANDDTATSLIAFRVTATQRATIEMRAAANNADSLSGWIRRKLLLD